MDEDKASRAPGGMTYGGLRKRVLLGILAEEERARRGLIVDSASIEEAARWYRARFDLLRRQDMLRFLQDSDITERDFGIVMRTFATVDLLELQYDEHIASEVARHGAVLGVRDWVLRNERT